MKEGEEERKRNRDRTISRKRKKVEDMKRNRIGGKGGKVSRKVSKRNKGEEERKRNRAGSISRREKSRGYEKKQQTRKAEK